MVAVGVTLLLIGAIAFGFLRKKRAQARYNRVCFVRDVQEGNEDEMVVFEA